MFLKHTANVHIRFRNGKDTYDAVTIEPQINEIARTLWYQLLNGIHRSYPLDVIFYWESGRTDQLEKPEPAPTDVVYQDPDQDWPVETKGY